MDRGFDIKCKFCKEDIKIVYNDSYCQFENVEELQGNYHLLCCEQNKKQRKEKLIVEKRKEVLENCLMQVFL